MGDERRMRRTLIACGAALSMSVALAHAAEKAAFTAGPGATTCAQFARSYAADPNAELAYFFWAQGWFSGVNGMEGMTHGRKRSLKDLFSIPMQEQMLILREYCDQHPLEMYADATAFLWTRLTAVTLPALTSETK